MASKSDDQLVRDVAVPVGQVGDVGRRAHGRQLHRFLWSSKLLLAEIVETLHIVHAKRDRSVTRRPALRQRLALLTAIRVLRYISSAHTYAKQAVPESIWGARHPAPGAFAVGRAPPGPFWDGP